MPIYPCWPIMSGHTDTRLCLLLHRNQICYIVWFFVVQIQRKLYLWDWYDVIRWKVRLFNVRKFALLWYSVTETLQSFLFRHFLPWLNQSKCQFVFPQFWCNLIFINLLHEMGNFWRKKHNLRKELYLASSVVTLHNAVSVEAIL